ncbi:MAG: response regulator [Prevotella sp.]|nr:response regulator [Prevotella sp.]
MQFRNVLDNFTRVLLAFVALLLLSMPRVSAYDKWHLSAADIEVVDSCDSYDVALQSILCYKPDLLFMDIQLQGRTAMQLLDELKESMTLPKVIFTTAYAECKYLMGAIKLSAVDYLLKPVDKNELALALAKVMGDTNFIYYIYNNARDR